MKKEIEQAKAALDNIIKKGRTHLYKPIQVAEVLYRYRTTDDIDLDDVFNETAVPPKYIKILAEENKRLNGAVEAHIYGRIINRRIQ